MKKIVKLYEEYTSFEGSLFVYSLSFSLLLALAPALTLVVMGFNFLFLDAELITSVITHYLPADLVEPFINYLISKGSINYVTSIVSMCVSLWLASRSTYSFNLITARNENIDYPKWMIRIKSILQFFVIITYILTAVILVTKMSMISFIYLPVFYVLFSSVGFYWFYRSISFVERETSYGLLGALFSTLAIFLTGVLFFQIINRFTNYESVYGPLSSLVILFLSVFVIASIIYMGYVINDIYADEYKTITKKHSIMQYLDRIQTSTMQRLLDRFQRKQVK